MRVVKLFSTRTCERKMYGKVSGIFFRLTEEHEGKHRATQRKLIVVT